MTTLYGISNCDTVKKAIKWLKDQSIEYTFSDFRKDGLTAGQVKSWANALGWEALLNKRSTTWRQLPDADKAGIDEASAIRLMTENPTLIKRPVLEHGATTLIGFSEARYQELFK